ncbi:MAG: SidA/IucD/PvdA family monooxygenase [Aquabacterium sp.]
MLLDDATMQTPFMADLVTLADPTSRYSFLNYAKQQGRLYRFCIREDFFLLRQEYNQYCQWVAGQLDNLRFQRFVQHAHYDSIEQCYVLLCLCTRTGRTERHRARRLVIGTGTHPWLPACCEAVRHQVVHSSAYLAQKAALQGRRHIVVVGSGQSAAEIYLDLLRDRPRLGYRLDWITRAPRFFPLEYTKLTLEMTSPDYVDHFHALPPARRDTLLQSQQVLYKGINRSLINAIYDELYRQDLQGQGTQGLMTHTALTSCRHDAASKRFTLGLQHTELGRTRQLSCDAVVMATGYAWRQPPFMEGIEGRLRRDARGRLDVARNYSIDLLGREVFVQNAELHTHGFTAPDLSMAAYRNSVILQAMLGKAPYAIEERIAFQQFGSPSLETEADKEQAWG